MIGPVGRVVILPREDLDDPVTRNWFAVLKVCDSFYPSNWGDEARPDDSILMNLMMMAWRAVLFNGIKAEDMHKALLVIPEYRHRIGIYD